MLSINLLDERETAAKLKLPVSTLRYWRFKHNGGPRYLKMGRRVFYRADWIDEYITSCAREVTGGSANGSAR